jgi:GntR family transcriptional regulator
MLALAIDQNNPTELHEQVAAEIRRAIAEGEANPGDRLPPAKDLAEATGVTPGTILRAVRTLRNEGILEFRRGRGITVTATPDRSAVINQARVLLLVARRHGYSRAELIELIESLG